ncbi:MAG: alpha/beta fold hydrolase [Bacteroidales bacterium]|nr:alpha/beta fold hydrolase [Bacteroidales bacterium]
MKLFYRQFGEGQPVVILHGIFGISDNWVTIGRRLAEKFEVFIPDQRNHGQSPHSATFNYFSLVDDLREFIEDRELSHPILIGHSMGGKVAMNFAMEYPGRIEKLVVVDMSMRRYEPRQEHMQILQAMLQVDFDAVSSREEVEDIISVSVKSKRVRMFIMKNLYRINDNRFSWRLNVDSINENIDNIFEGIDSPYTFEKPSLFIRGGNSDYIQDQDFEKIQRYFPKSKLQTIEGASHWVHADKPDELCAMFSEFLEKDCEFNVK